MYTTQPPSPSYVDPEISLFQPDVYALAGFLAHTINAHAVLDIGCGKGSKLFQLKQQYGFTLIGIDTAEHVDYCRKQGPREFWFAHNAEKPYPDIVLPYDTVVVCADFLEHIEQVQHTLEFLQRHHASARTPLMFFSTPERELAHGFDHPGPPENKHHVREWSMSEFHALLTDAGLPIQFHGITRSYDAPHHKSLMTTQLVIVGR